MINNVACHDLAAAGLPRWHPPRSQRLWPGLHEPLHLRNNGRTFDNCGIQVPGFQNSDTAGLGLYGFLNWTG